MDKQAMHGIIFDYARSTRIGMPEAIFCEGKSLEAIEVLIQEHGNTSNSPALFTRLKPEVYYSLPKKTQSNIHYHTLSWTAYSSPLSQKKSGKVAIVSAGTADARTAWEAAKTLEYLGIQYSIYEDNGVAALWRLMENLEKINSYDAIIVIAGLDAALASVMGGLTPKPVIAVPTSVGYGVARNGEAALTSMLVSCAPGVSVMNIDNGYGGACAAARIINLIHNMKN